MIVCVLLCVVVWRAYFFVVVFMAGVICVCVCDLSCNTVDVAVVCCLCVCV